MKLLLVFSLVLNLMIVGCEIWTFTKLKRKMDIAKYYTFLQNFLALTVSGIFSIFLIKSIFFNGIIPEVIKGMRYITTCGLIATTFIYVIFLSSNSSNLLSEEDFVSGFNPKLANFLLHYFCPIISLLSFLVFEREILLTQSIWTILVMIPSCLYWGVYVIISVINIAELPYDLTLSNNKNNNLVNALVMMSIPLSFILISYIIWLVK